MEAPIQIHPSKRLGQNFLIDNRAATKIVSVAELEEKDTVLEPGAGYGTLTRLLGNRAGRVIAVEKDHRLASHLRKKFANNSSVLIVEGDVLKAELPTFNKVIGTPPYIISSKLILLLAKKKFDLASLVFQKEFGERLVAKPGTPDYGRLSIKAQRSFSIQSIMDIPAESFRPRPKIDSLLLRISPRTIERQLDEGTFEELVRGLFNQRRRLVRSSLTHFLSKKLGHEQTRALLETVNLPEKRVYEMTLNDLEELSEQLSKAL